MLHINPYLLPGTYSEVENPTRIVVVTEVANYVYSEQKKMHEYNALVIYRPLIVSKDPDHHEVYATPLEVFNKMFVKI